MKRKTLSTLPIKPLFVGLVGAVCGLTAISTSATIVGSRHDLRSYLNLGSGAEICVVCHTPHDADGNNGDGTTVTEAPLWNHEITADSTTYNMYSSNGSGTLDGLEDDRPTGASRLCLSCHDGTVGIDNYGGGPNSGATLPIDNPYYVGTDLTGQHPISIEYNPDADPGLFPADTAVTIGGYDSGAVALPTREGTIDSLMLQNGKVQCSSCHDVHNTFVATSEAMLRIDVAGSELCLTCHNK